MKGPAVAASLLVLVYTAAIHATQVQGHGSAALAVEVGSVQASNPELANSLSALLPILSSSGGRLTGPIRR